MEGGRESEGGRGREGEGRDGEGRSEGRSEVGGGRERKEGKVREEGREGWEGWRAGWMDGARWEGGRLCVCTCVHACSRVCVRACVYARVRVCMHDVFAIYDTIFYPG